MSDAVIRQRQTLDDGMMVQVEGEIDLVRSPRLRVELMQMLKGKPARLVIDLSGVPYMDSSGVATLVEALQVQRKQNGKLIICAPQAKVRSIFEIARLDTIFTIVDDTAAATKA